VLRHNCVIRRFCVHPVTLVTEAKDTRGGAFRYMRHNFMETSCSCYEGHRVFRLGPSSCALWRRRDLGSRPDAASDAEIQESYRKGIVE
jgi:hypothetical protein